MPSLLMLTVIAACSSGSGMSVTETVGSGNPTTDQASTLTPVTESSGETDEASGTTGSTDGTQTPTDSTATSDSDAQTDTESTSDTDTGTVSETDTDSDTDTGGEPATDEALLRAAIAGEISPEDALATISQRGGLPVATEQGTHLFACLCGPGTWQLAGDHDGWAGAEMAQTGELSWTEVSIFEPNGSIYKFHDGQDSWVPDPMGRRYGYDDNGEYSLVDANGPHLERWFGLSGFDLGPRDLQVWVPQDGQFSHALYAHDGQNLFDPQAPGGGWQFSQFLPEEMLVVGIDNTGFDRMYEYTHVVDEIQGEPIGGLGDNYADLVEQVIRPRMEAAYGEADVVGTLGSSLGGLISFHIADRYPDRYDMALSLSGTMGWGSIGDGVMEPTMIERYLAAGHRSTALYLDSGGSGTCIDSDADMIEDDGDDSDNYCVNNQLRDALVSIGYTFGLDLWHWHEADAEHSEIYWAQRLAYPLGLFSEI